VINGVMKFTRVELGVLTTLPLGGWNCYEEC